MARGDGGRRKENMEKEKKKRKKGRRPSKGDNGNEKLPKQEKKTPNVANPLRGYFKKTLGREKVQGKKKGNFGSECEKE